MAQKRSTPVDKLTGLPLPIWPCNELPNKSELPTYLNPHHHFHPKKGKYIKKEEEGKFLRNSRIQVVPRWIHNSYHEIYYGPPINKEEQDRLMLGIFAVAGYLPRYAIDAPASEALGIDVIRHIDDDLYMQITNKKVLRCEATKTKERRDKVCNFMMRVIFKQDFSDIDQLTVEQFLDTKDEDTRLEMGRIILDKLTEQSTEPIEPIYNYLYRKNMIIKRNIRRASGVIRQTTCPNYYKYMDDLTEVAKSAIAA